MSHGLHKPPPGSHAHEILGDAETPQAGQIHTLPEGSVAAADGSTISWSQGPTGAITAVGAHNEQLVVSRYRPSKTAGTDVLHGGDMATAPAASDPQNADPVDAGPVAGPKHPGHLAGLEAGHVGNVDPPEAGESADPISGLRLAYGSVGDPDLTITHVTDETRQAFFIEVTGLLASATFRGRTDGGDPTSVPVTVSAKYRPHHQTLDWQGTLDVTKSPVQTIVLIPGWWLDAFKLEMPGAAYFDPLAEVVWNAFAPQSGEKLGHGVIAKDGADDGGGMAWRAGTACLGGAFGGVTAAPEIAPLAALAGCVVAGDLSMLNDAWPDIKVVADDAWSGVTADLSSVLDQLVPPDPDIPDDPEVPDDGCFAEGTAVATPTGAPVAIEAVAVGDLVCSRAESVDEQGARRVTRIWQHHHKPTVDLVLDTTERVRTTAAHRFFTLERGIVAAGELQVGERLQTLGGVPRAIINIEPGPAGATVYNLTVEGLHTYFVADAGVWVHNDKHTEPDDPPPDPDGSGGGGDDPTGPDDDDGGTTPGGGSGSGSGSGPTPA